MTERELCGGGERDGRQIRQRILEAAGVCYLRYGVERTTLGDVAEQVSLSRQTVSEHYGCVDELLSAVLLGSLSQLWWAMDEEVKHAATYCDYLVDGLIFAVTHGPRRPPCQLLFLQSVAAPLRNLLLGDREYILQRSNALAGKYEATYRRRTPAAPAPDPLLVAEWFHRQFLSYQTRSLFFGDDTLRAMLLHACPGRPLIL